jgi:hypothetical protein
MLFDRCALLKLIQHDKCKTEEEKKYFFNNHKKLAKLKECLTHTTHTLWYGPRSLRHYSSLFFYRSFLCLFHNENASF